ncbi:hypothetical protein C0216_03880 [Streptomyces globosus]|uniref:Uncharacterized protein n=1 Tax=Streptomyces globosus TaxID=68209 RepID=A0A344TVM4_9ACTN|nr:hypothetical protein [Streptomyces globosus]AXE22695.1 hypothetical protein C0216_03880 [Streptomyces globosus]
MTAPHAIPALDLPVSDAWAEAAAAAHGAREDAPTGDPNVQTASWTPQRLHAARQLALDRGGTMFIVAAVTPEGEAAAYTGLVLPDPDGPRAPSTTRSSSPATAGRASAGP